MKIVLNLLLVLLLQQGYAQCGDQHSNTEETQWLSCEQTTNPNSARSQSHWIMYDLGFEYTLTTSKIWNYNLTGFTQYGFRNVVIDYSTDGENWTTLSEMQFPEADGSADYTGFEGPDFNSSNARYVLITAIDAYNDSGCAGIAEVRFNVANVVTSNENTIIAKSDIGVYPNPVQHILNFDLKDEQIENISILSLEGKTYHSQAAKGNAIDVSYLAPGQYIVQFLTKNGLVNKRFIKI